jgi:hypothetical protein
VRRERDRTTRAARPGEDGGFHAGVRHDAGAVQEELGVKGRNWEGESSWKSGGDEHVFIASR